MQKKRSVVVIGAGISGLVCAYRLKHLGVDVLLIERSNRPGGVIQSDRIEGFLVERGPNSSQGTDELIALIQELGITSELIEGDPKAPVYVYFNGALHPVPSGVGSFVRSNLLSFSGKLRILQELFVRPRGDSTEESVADFVRRRIGREAAERLVAPFVSGIFAGDAERLGVQAAFPKVVNLETRYGSLIRGAFAKAREARNTKKSAEAAVNKAVPARKRVISFRDGMGYLPSVLSDRLGEDLRLQCAEIRVRMLRREEPDADAYDDSSVVVEFEQEGNRERVECEQFVVATPAPSAAVLLKDASRELSRLLQEIEYPPLSIVSLSYDESAIGIPLDGFGFLPVPTADLRVLGCVWNSSLFRDRAPKGKALLTVFIGGARHPDEANLPDAELVSIAHSDLQRVLSISAKARALAITRHERSIPQYNLGHCERVKQIENLIAGMPRLNLVGNYLHGVSTGDCVKEADRIARDVASKLQH